MFKHNQKFNHTRIVDKSNEIFYSFFEILLVQKIRMSFYNISIKNFKQLCYKYMNIYKANMNKT